jgi:hypothetical protein
MHLSLTDLILFILSMAGMVGVGCAVAFFHLPPFIAVVLLFSLSQLLVISLPALVIILSSVVLALGLYNIIPSLIAHGKNRLKMGKNSAVKQNCNNVLYIYSLTMKDAKGNN